MELDKGYILLRRRADQITMIFCPWGDPFWQGDIPQVLTSVGKCCPQQGWGGRCISPGVDCLVQRLHEIVDYVSQPAGAATWCSLLASRFPLLFSLDVPAPVPVDLQAYGCRVVQAGLRM